MGLEYDDFVYYECDEGKEDYSKDFPTAVPFLDNYIQKECKINPVVGFISIDFTIENPLGAICLPFIVDVGALAFSVLFIGA